MQDQVQVDLTELVRYSPDALEHPILPPLQPPPEGVDHDPADRVEDGHDSGDDRDGHSGRADVVADGLPDEEGVEDGAEEHDAAADGERVREQPHEQRPVVEEIAFPDGFSC